MNKRKNIQNELRDQQLDSLEFKKSRKRKKEGGGFFWRLTSPIREWNELPSLIQDNIPKSQKNLTHIDEMMIDFRLSIIKTTHIAKNVNQQIWGDYQTIKRKNEGLLLETNKRSLILRSLKQLRKIHSDWENLLREQEELLDSISRAPASLKFYNMMMTYQEIRQQERMDDEYNQRRYKEAHRSLELALKYAEEHISNKDNDFYEKSRILSLDSARQFWSDQLVEINELQKAGSVEIETILEKIEKLKNIIFESPPTAKWIYDTEQRYFRLVNDHDLLRNMYGKTIIHADEIKENDILMTERIPKLWVTGDTEQLDYYLKQIENFLARYEVSIQEELAYQERHSPWASTKDGGNEDEISMLTSFVRIMINAVESREAHMGDHSGTVARLAKGTAEELQWSEHELKYLEIAGLLHDIGKIWIPESLLTKPGPLTENEFEVIRLHPFYSAKIVESISALKEIVPWVYYHHERWDGNGYPESLKQSEIPLGASIIAVAEAFSSMIFNRLSREPLTIDQAFQQIRDGSGRQFDPDVTEAFISAASKMRPDLEKLQENGFSPFI